MGVAPRRRAAVHGGGAEEVAGERDRAREHEERRPQPGDGGQELGEQPGLRVDPEEQDGREDRADKQRQRFRRAEQGRRNRCRRTVPVRRHAQSMTPTVTGVRKHSTTEAVTAWPSASSKAKPPST
jgi:hypothetical protein